MDEDDGAGFDGQVFHCPFHGLLAILIFVYGHGGNAADFLMTHDDTIPLPRRENVCVYIYNLYIHI